jgi:hypothetical protein
MAEDSDRRLTAFQAWDYETLLSALQARGYADVFIAELDPRQRHMFVRHDVDLCPERALEIGRREAVLGVRSTFYFLVSTPLYSTASASTRRILAELLSLGHEIGLHFDVEQYADRPESLDAAAEHECAILECCIGRSVRSISFHRPAPALLNRPGLIAGRRHCYEPAFFSEIGYISDSNGGWHHGHPLNHCAVREGRAIQLLTHPIWWCNDPPMATAEIMDRLFEARRDALQASLAGTVKAYRAALEERDT